MKTHNVSPGTPEWHALRARCRCASEAPVIMSASRHMTRQEFVRMKALGLEKEFSDYVREHVLAKGHEIEAAAREVTEEQFGTALYAAVVTDDEEQHLASLDGMPMDEAFLWECKSSNADLRAMIERAVVDDPQYYWQLEHQLMTVPHADETRFTVSDGTPAGTHTLTYKRVAGRREQLLAGWEQVEKDIAEYVHVAEPKPVVGQRVQASLPALIVEVSGQVIDSNLAQFREAALAIIESVNTDLQTDQDFADAREGIKFCDTVQDRVKLVKEQALGKMISVDEAFKALDDVAEAARQQRLLLERLVRERDTSLKAEIVQGGKEAFAAHVVALNTRLGKAYMPTIATDFAACIRNKRSFKNMRDAVAAELARAKIEANRIADLVDGNLKMLREVAAEYAFLFPAAETALLVLKEAEACRAIAEKRIADYIAERDRLARAVEAQRQKEAQEAEERRREREQRAQAPAPAPTPAPAPIAAPAPATQAAAPLPPVHRASARPAQPTRPSDDQIIEVLALHYRAHESTVVAWLLSMDLQAASDRLAEHI